MLVYYIQSIYIDKNNTSRPARNAVQLDNYESRVYIKKKSIKIHIHQTKIENDYIRFLMFEILSFQKIEPGTCASAVREHKSTRQTVRSIW